MACGIGLTPFVALAKEHRCSKVYGLSQRVKRPVPRIPLSSGARSASLLAGLDDFESAGAELWISTDDGSAGHHGLLTDLVERLLHEEPSSETVRIVCCGPEKTMEAVSNIPIQRKVPVQVSLETPWRAGSGSALHAWLKLATKREPQIIAKHASRTWYLMQNASNGAERQSKKGVRFALVLFCLLNQTL